MDTNQHIQFLIDQAEEDMGASEALAQAGFYGHALFWAHLVLEKLCKALWIRANNDSDYPHIHNLTRILKESNIELSQEQVLFYSDMTKFQAKIRYPDTLRAIEITVTKELFENFWTKIEIEKTWLLNQLQ